MCGILCGNCCVVLSCGNGQKNHRNVQKYHRNGQKKHRNGQKNTGILCGISYGTLIAVWYCPVVMGKKTTGMGKKTTGIVCGFPIVH